MCIRSALFYPSCQPHLAIKKWLKLQSTFSMAREWLATGGLVGRLDIHSRLNFVIRFGVVINRFKAWDVRKKSIFKNMLIITKPITSILQLHMGGCELDRKIPFLPSLLSTNYKLSTAQGKSATNDDDLTGQSYFRFQSRRHLYLRSSVYPQGCGMKGLNQINVFS